MKHSSMIGIATVAIAFVSAACGANDDGLNESDVASVDAAETSSDANGLSEDREGEVASSEEAITFGRECNVTYSVTAISAGAYCPQSIGGHGGTTFLGGCHKACERARGDAAGKLPSGCVLNENLSQNCNGTSSQGVRRWSSGTTGP